MSGKRGISNLNASLNSTKAAKEVLNSKRPKGSPGKKTKQQEAPTVSQEADHTLSYVQLLQETPPLGSEPSSSDVAGAQPAPETAANMKPTVEHGAPPAPETAAHNNEPITSAEDGRRHSSRIANATAKTGGGIATQGSSDILQNDEEENNDREDNEDEIRSNTTGEGRTPTKPYAVSEKRGRGRPYKSPSQGLCATLHGPFPNPNTFYP
jgi:hypothetical protein